ncbi:Polyadenylation and cleavage factor-like protein 4 [Nymphaea thermarum]|nr:Polyadenylation and cleavage factor-like protein 4 [Nymphaea thermarum]
MEAQSSRRPIDKQREIGLKKPRLEETAERRVPARASGTGSNAFLARFRTNERERDGSRGRIAVDEVKEREEPGRRAYHQQQELLSQYKTALGELTFNSKPIITNLTIIAGENTHAAKGIAATICANILEVPNEQKLPSLYLLDSIVKNIGGDYIKYFAARLPEVFCEAYRKVDPSTHPSMQHLFRTWRSVFPSPTLRIIEQELNFPPSANSSSSGGASTSKTDPQSQRPAHGIHVNPKYFEARQHLQQSNRSKGSEAENSRSILKEDIVGPAQISVSGGPKRWAEVSAKMAGDDKLIESYDKRPGSGYLDYEIISDPPNHQKVANKWSGERATEGNEGTDDAWHRGTGGNKANTLLGRTHLPSRGLVDSYGSHRASRSGGTLPQLDSVPNTASLGSRNTLRNWKNSDEEEFVWDDMNSRVTDIIEADGLKKGGRNHDYSTKSLGEQMRKWMPADSEQLARRWSEGGLLSRSEQPVRGNDKFPAQMELDDQESLGWKEAHPLDKKGMSIDSSSAGQEVEPRFGHQTGRIPLNQLNLSRSISRLRPSDALKHPTNDSIGTDQVEGFSVTLAGSSNANVSQPSLAKVGVGMQIGPIATSTFGSLQHVAPGFSGTPAQQQNWKPLSPSGHALHQRSHSPSSSSPHQLAYRVQPQNLPEQEHPEVMSFPIGQNAMRGGLAKASPEIQGNQKLQGQASNQFNSRLSVHLQPLQQFDNISSIPAQQRTHLPFLQAEPSQPPGLLKPAQTQPQDFGFQITPTSLKNSSAGLSGHTSTSSLLATIVNNGLLSLNSAASGDVTKSTSSFSDMSHSELIHSQSRISTLPPLPTGPPPMQISTSSQGPGQESALSALSHSLLGTSQPPLPPGPPPPSSVVGTSSQSSGNVATNPLSNLLSSLVAKGLISTSASETSKVNPTLVPIQTQNQNDGAVASNSILGSLKPNLLMTSPLTPPDGDLSISESSSLPSGHPNASAENRECIGVEFKPEVIREFHASVINGLFDDLPCQCSICGFRLKDEDSLSKHLGWHDSRKLEVNNTKRMSRKWYASLREWIEGEVGPSSNAMDVLAHGSTLCAESSEPMVSADESQCICALCGEPFEDFYCHKRDEWMFKGAVFMNMSTNGAGTVDPDFSPKQIVHVNCSSKRSCGGLED